MFYIDSCSEGEVEDGVLDDYMFTCHRRHSNELLPVRTAIVDEDCETVRSYSTDAAAAVQLLYYIIILYYFIILLLFLYFISYSNINNMIINKKYNINKYSPQSTVQSITYINKKK